MLEHNEYNPTFAVINYRHEPVEPKQVDDELLGSMRKQLTCVFGALYPDYLRGYKTVLCSSASSLLTG